MVRFILFKVINQEYGIFQLLKIQNLLFLLDKIELFVYGIFKMEKMLVRLIVWKENMFGNVIQINK